MRSPSATVAAKRSLAVSEGSLKDADGKLYAHATATLMLLRGR